MEKKNTRIPYLNNSDNTIRNILFPFKAIEYDNIVIDPKFKLVLHLYTSLRAYYWGCRLYNKILI